jgi:hypothetical protein
MKINLKITAKGDDPSSKPIISISIPLKPISSLPLRSIDALLQIPSVNKSDPTQTKDEAIQ